MVFLGASNVIRCLQTLSAVGALVNLIAINECAQDAGYFRKKLRGIMLESDATTPCSFARVRLRPKLVYLVAASLHTL